MEMDFRERRKKRPASRTQTRCNRTYTAQSKATQTQIETEPNLGVWCLVFGFKPTHEAENRPKPSQPRARQDPSGDRN
jgi:hypothetical protein